MLLGAAPAAAAPGTVSDPAADSTAPAIAFGPGSEATIVWQTQTSRFADPNLVQARRISADGEPGPILDLSEAGSFPTPQVAIGPSGTSTVVWVEADGIRAKQISPDGEAGPLRNLASTDTSDQITDLSIAIDGQGNVTATWIRFLASGGRILEVSRIDFDGFVGENLVVQGRQVESPEVVSNFRGRSTIVYQVRRGKHQRIKAARYTPAAALEPIGRLSQKSGRSLEPAVAIDGRGRVTVAWQRFGRRNALQTTRLDRSSRPGTIYTVKRSRRNSFIEPQLAIDPENRPRLIWEDARGHLDGATLNQRAKPRRIYRLASGAKDLEDLNLVVGSEGTTTAAWLNYDGRISTVNAATYKADGQERSDSVLARYEGGEAPEQLDLAIDERDRPAAVWCGCAAAGNTIQLARLGPGG